MSIALGRSDISDLLSGLKSPPHFAKLAGVFAECRLDLAVVREPSGFPLHGTRLFLRVEPNLGAYVEGVAEPRVVFDQGRVRC